MSLIDLKESIPQFYDTKSGIDLLLNLSGLQLGVTQTGTIINDVELPKWARSPKDFLKKNRKALESDYCSKQLPYWINLIFGSSSRGVKAEEAMNVFHPTSYLGPKDIEALDTEEKKAQAELQATEFGICPDMLFCEPHPSKHDGFVDFANLFNLELDRDLDINFNENGCLDEINDSKEWELLSSHDLSVHQIDEDVRLQQRRDEGRQILQNDTPKGIMSQTTSLSTGSKETPEIIATFAKFEMIEGNAKTLQAKHIPLSGSGDSNRHSEDNMDICSGTFGISSNNTEEKKYIGSSMLSDDSFKVTTPSLNKQYSQDRSWEFQPIASAQIHSNTVTGCCVSFGPKKSIVTTTSLDGNLMVHVLSNNQNEKPNFPGRKGFSNIQNLASLHVSHSSLGVGGNHARQGQRFHVFRSHTSTTPLACLTTVTDATNNSQVAFTGGHDDVIMAYGVNSACGLASVYSHRDVITGIDVVPFKLDSNDNSSTHIMISGSEDAMVKLWNVSIRQGEVVEIDKDPILELFDAESSILDVSGFTTSDIGGKTREKGIYIAAGCTDGSIISWFWNGQSKTIFLHSNSFDCVTSCLSHKTPLQGNIVKYRHEARRDLGPCTCIQWVVSQDKVLLVAGFRNGRIATFVLQGEKCLPVGVIDIGASVRISTC